MKTVVGSNRSNPALIIHYRPLLTSFGAILLALWGVGARAKHEPHAYKAWERALMRTLKRAAPSKDAPLMRLPSWIGTGGFLPLDSLILLLLMARKRHDAAQFFGFSVGGMVALRELAKRLVRRRRPSLWAKLGLEHKATRSFPSGHAMGAMTLIATLSSMAWPTRWRWPALLLGGPFVLLVGVSRIVREEHYPFDVLVGWVAALVWVRGCDTWVAREPNARRAG